MALARLTAGAALAHASDLPFDCHVARRQFNSLSAGEVGVCGAWRNTMAVAFRTPARMIEKNPERGTLRAPVLGLRTAGRRGVGGWGCRSAAASAPKAKRQLQLHLSVVGLNVCIGAVPLKKKRISGTKLSRFDILRAGSAG